MLELISDLADEYLLKVAYYFDGNENYQDEYYPYDNFFYPGETIEKDDGNGYYRGHNPRMEDRQRDGKEFKEFEEFRRKRRNRLKRLKLLRKLHKTDKQDKPFTPTPASLGAYGPIGIEGLYTSPMEYYGGNIADGPDANTNPYYQTYQMNSITASSNLGLRAKIRAEMLANLIKRS